MEMHQVRYFLAVAEQLNFTKAAESCNVSQPSLTRAIKLLEEEFGGLLFHRERANTHLTDLGRTVRPHLQQIYDEAHAAKRLAQDLAKLRRVTLKLGIMCTVAPTQLIDLLTSVQTRYDHIEIEFTDASARELETMLLDGNLEVAILCRPDRELDERIHTMPLFREQMMVVVPPNHLLATKDAIRVKDLHGMNYVNRAKCEFNGYAGQFFREQGVECRTVYRSERDDWVLAMIRSGLGFGFMPEFSVTDPAVIARPLIEPDFWRTVNLCTVRGRPYTPAVGALVREVMRVDWLGLPAMAVTQIKEKHSAEPDLLAAD
ncbi:MAG TPA: LysR family transcriptional regulator [Rhodoplanes sp.]|nr:LysR family transcriptional regulator [Rhodoplanes sp.]